MATGPSRPRRRFLATALGLAASGCTAWREGLFNPCATEPLPRRLAEHELVRAAWKGVDPAAFRDCHVHLAGVGDSEGVVWLNPDMRTLAKPFALAHAAFFLDGACVPADSKHVDESYVARLVALLDAFPAGARAMLFALDAAYDDGGRFLAARTVMLVSNAYARDVAARRPDRFEWIASVHPYRRDAVEVVEAAAAQGARAVKWIPSLMNIDPASPRCDEFYGTLARLDLPLLTHSGYEHPIQGSQNEMNAPSRLRRALDHGVRVIVAHCATEGASRDPTRGDRETLNFTQFAQLMDDPRYEGRVFGDISAITGYRDPKVLREILVRTDWHPRLLYGSDYPLPGILPMMSVEALAAQGFLASAKVPILIELRRYNALLFDFVLKRHLRADGRGFAPAVFQARRYFAPRRPHPR
jgi:mannonate dehydratase